MIVGDSGRKEEGSREQFSIRKCPRRSRCRSLCRSQAASRHATTTGSVALASVWRRVRCLSGRLCSQVKEGFLGIGITKVEREKQKMSRERKTAERSHSKHENRTPLCLLILARTLQKGNTRERTMDLPTAFGLRSEIPYKSAFETKSETQPSLQYRALRVGARLDRNVSRADECSGTIRNETLKLSSFSEQLTQYRSRHPHAITCGSLCPHSRDYLGLRGHVCRMDES